MSDNVPAEFKPYAAVHKNTKGAGDARPTAYQIVKDNDLEGKWGDKVVLITGCSSGIGIDTAKALKATGAHVYATARNLEKGKKALAGALEPGKLDLELLDLNSLSSVRSFARSFLEKTGGMLNILINNAGVMETPEGKTEDGFETQFGTNHLAHFLLFQLLKPALLSSSTPEFNSRVVSVSSTGHHYNDIDLDNIMLEGGVYEPARAYSHSKTANILFANGIEHRYGSRGLHANSLHPGYIMEGSGLGVHVQGKYESMAASPEVQAHLKNCAQGAATSVWAAVAKVLEGVGGKYMDDCQVCGPVPVDGSLMSRGYKKWAMDQEKEERLWRLSNKLVGLKEDE
ncbi:NAD(P)-binding protein [Byssothecium circinans]|uniref:NAD(P)-binding protein n=1 Tax=Byssothecium circinans TaxID=147558 RepID=A0A6A5TUI8_9PLEO|nr:NAD(P)-binding protein [Byssothecium circinans]